MTHPLVEWAWQIGTPEFKAAFRKRIRDEARAAGAPLWYRDDAVGGYVREDPDGRR